jgi:hypothetical protein
MDATLHALEHANVPSFAAKLIVIAALLLVAWLVSGLARAIAGWIVAIGSTDQDESGALAALGRQETAISLVQTAIRYVAFLIAVVLALVVASGGPVVAAVAGASFLAVLLGFAAQRFAAQRFLTDVLAGLVMFVEGWFTVGSTVVIEPLELEASSRRSRSARRRYATSAASSSACTTPRSRPSAAFRRGRGGSRSTFVRDLDAGEELVEDVARVVPSGATAFVRPPRVRETAVLD